MSENNSDGLRRYDAPILPSVFHMLSDEDKRSVVLKIIDSDLELKRIMEEKHGNSDLAMKDLEETIIIINRLQDERKVYTYTSAGKTGSGTYELNVRGGDTRFINSIALALIAVVAAIALLLAIA
jgi:hypothetical protein